MPRFKTILASAIAALTVGGFAVFAQADQPPDPGHTPVTICHHAGPFPENWHTITVDDDSVTLQAHLGHGDTIGACAPVETTTTTPPPPPTTTTETTTPKPPAPPVHAGPVPKAPAGHVSPAEKLARKRAAQIARGERRVLTHPNCHCGG